MVRNLQIYNNSIEIDHHLVKFEESIHSLICSPKFIVVTTTPREGYGYHVYVINNEGEIEWRIETNDGYTFDFTEIRGNGDSIICGLTKSNTWEVIDIDNRQLCIDSADEWNNKNIGNHTEHSMTLIFINNNSLTSANSTNDFPSPIHEVWQYNDITIIALSYLIGDNRVIERNVYRMNEQGKIVWQIQSIRQFDENRFDDVFVGVFVGVQKHEQHFRAITYFERWYEFDVETGKILATGSTRTR